MASGTSRTEAHDKWSSTSTPVYDSKPSLTLRGSVFDLAARIPNVVSVDHSAGVVSIVFGIVSAIVAE